MSEPSCSVDYPGNGDDIKDKVTFTGSCSDNFEVKAASVSVERVIGWWTGSGWDPDSEHWLNATLSQDATSFWWYDDGIWASEINYTIRAKAIDDAGNEKISTSNTFLYDPVSPDSSVSVPVDGKFYRSLPEISGTSGDGVSGSGVTLVKVKVIDLTESTTYYWNGENGWTTTEAGTWFNRKSGLDPWKYYLGTSTSTSDGYWTSGHKYKIQCKAYDLAGNEETSFGEAIYYFDNTPSTSVVSVPIDGDSYNSLTEISGDASDGGSGVYPAGVDYVEVRIKNPDGDYWDEENKVWGSEEWNVATGSTSWSVSITTSAWSSDKVYTINSRAYDNAEYPSTNVEINYSTYTFTYDVVKPTSTVTQPIDGRYYSSLNLITGTSYDKTTGVDTTDISIQRYNAPYQDYYWEGQLSVSTTAWDSGDRYRIKSKATDNTDHNANIEDVSAKTGNIFTFDNIAPASTIVQPEATGYNELDELRVTATDSASGTYPAGVGKVEISLQIDPNGSPPGDFWDGTNGPGHFTLSEEEWIEATWNDPYWTISISSTTWTSGYEYRIKAKAEDSVPGNPNVEVAGSGVIFSIDNLAPTSAFILPEDEQSYNSLPQIEGTADDDASGVKEVWITILNETAIPNLYYQDPGWDEGIKWHKCTGTTDWYYISPSWDSATQYKIDVRHSYDQSHG